MKRRTKQRMTAIHVSIPVRVLEDFDKTLRYNQSRSAKITSLIQESGGLLRVDLYTEASLKQIINKLIMFDEIDNTLEYLLLQVLAKTP